MSDNSPASLSGEVARAETLAAATPSTSSRISSAAAGGRRRAKPVWSMAVVGLPSRVAASLPQGALRSLRRVAPDSMVMAAEIGIWGGGPRTWWRSSHGGWRLGLRLPKGTRRYARGAAASYCGGGAGRTPCIDDVVAA